MGRQAAKHTQREKRIAKQHNQEMASRIREMRFLMGLSQTDVFKGVKMNPGQYTRIEAGELDGARVIKYLEPLFEVWKEKEIRRLEARIAYIKTL